MSTRHEFSRFVPASLRRRARPVVDRLGGRNDGGSGDPAFVSSTLDARLSYNRFGGYLVPNSSAHRPAAQLILRNEVYEADTIEFVRAHCADGDIVHAGAYFGDFLPALSSGCSPDAIVWAFEPNEENYRCAEVTTLVNGLRNVRLHHAGLGGRDDEVYVRIKDEDGRGLGGASSIVDSADHRADLDQAVHLVAVDGVVPRRRHVSIIQLDVEGHEQAALAGAVATIRRCRPIIIVEVLPGSDLLESSWFDANIRSLGYEQTRVLDGNVVFTTSTRPDRGLRQLRRIGSRRPQA